MLNLLEMSTEEQNSFVLQSLVAMLIDNKHYAEESGENVADYFSRDFDANPAGWDFAFEFAFDDISSKAKEERRIIIRNVLVSEGYVPTEMN